MAPPHQQQQREENATDEGAGSVSTPDRLPQAEFGRQRALVRTLESSGLPLHIYPLDGVVVEGTPDLCLRSVLADEEADDHEMVAAQIYPEMMSSLSSAPPTVPLDRVPGDQTRPMFTIRSDDSDDDNSSGTSTSSTQNSQGDYDGGDDDDDEDEEEEEKEEVGTEEERRWRLSERKEKAAHAARVAVADQCFHPRPRPITRYSGPMTVVHLDRMAALTDFRMEEDEEEASADEAGPVVEVSAGPEATELGEEEEKNREGGLERRGARRRRNCLVSPPSIPIEVILQPRCSFHELFSRPLSANGDEKQGEMNEEEEEEENEEDIVQPLRAYADVVDWAQVIPNEAEEAPTTTSHLRGGEGEEVQRAARGGGRRRNLVPPPGPLVGRRPSEELFITLPL
ncbi:hypothetical protein PG996_000427 [Apiospora saccharicola]|uniref:Uncharacterized protein n=1 Tax=Apiospora saccharicola TaxID=335842 RepID=A0ABR1WDR1_9PEZI